MCVCAPPCCVMSEKSGSVELHLEFRVQRIAALDLCLFSKPHQSPSWRSSDPHGGDPFQPERQSISE